MNIYFIGLTSMTLTAQTLLLTGGTGFVGSHVLEHAANSGRYATIYVPVRDVAKMERILQRWPTPSSTRIEILHGGGPDWPIVGLDIDEVIHTAGLTSGGNDDEYIQANVDTAIGLLEALPHSARVVMLSSLAAAGPTGPNGLAEGHIDQPITGYGRSKLMMEQRVLSEFSDRQVLILRPPMVLGPFDPATESLLESSRGLLIVRPGSSPTEKEHWYSFIDVDDLAVALLHAVSSRIDFKVLPSRVYDIAHEEAFSSQTMFETARAAVGGRGIIVPAPVWLIKSLSKLVESKPALHKKYPNLRADRVLDVPHSWRNCGLKFRQDFGVQPKRSLLESLQNAHRRR